MFESKFEKLCNKIIKENTDIDTVDKSSPLIKNFAWKHNRVLKHIEDPVEREEIVRICTQALVDEFKNSVGEKLEFYSPANDTINTVIEKISDDDQFVFVTKADTENYGRQFRWSIGLLMTDKVLDLFNNLIDDGLKKYKLKEQERQAEIKAAKLKQEDEFRATYNNPEVQAFIKSIPETLIGNYIYSGPEYTYSLPADFKQLFLAQPKNIQTGFINYILDMKIDDPRDNVYSDKVSLFEIKEYDRNVARKNKMIKELKELTEF